MEKIRAGAVWDDARAKLLAGFAGGREMYSVEVAALLGIRPRRALRYLRALALEGVMVSRYEPSTTGTMARRYFKLSDGIAKSVLVSPCDVDVTRSEPVHG